jgi:hypothetical protein
VCKWSARGGRSCSSVLGKRPMWLPLCGMFAVGAAVLSGCSSAQFAGRTGVTVDGSGGPVIVVAPCAGAVDTVRLSTLRGASGQHQTGAEVGSWVTAEQVGLGSDELDLNTPKGWALRSGSPRLEPDTHYLAFGESTRNGWTTTGVEFTTQSLAKLKPGDILQQRSKQDVVSDRAAFDKANCTGD